MKIFHTADWHLGNVFHRHERIDEHEHFFDWLLQQLRVHQPDVMIVAGDVFDNANPSAAAEKLYYKFLQQAIEAVSGLQIVVIAGNHDSAHRLEAPSPFLKANNIYVRGSVKRGENGEPDFENNILPLSLRTDSEARLVCVALPYLRACDYPSGMSAAEGLKYYFDKTKRALGHSEFRKLPVVVAAHFYASGAEISEEHSERLVVGGQDVVDVKVFDKYFRYMALGHIHRRQCVDSKSGVVINYSGSVLPMSFTEKNYKHGVVVVEIDDEGSVRCSNLDYVPLRSLLSLPQTGTAEPHEILELIAQLPDRHEGEDSATWPYVELRVLESKPEPTFLNDVTVALKEKAVRFCRMVRVLPTDIGDSSYHLELGSQAQTALNISPADLAQYVYKNKFKQAMPEEMLTRLETIVNNTLESPQNLKA